MAVFSIFKYHNPVQQMCVAVGVTFLLYLSLNIVIRSQDRTSIIASTDSSLAKNQSKVDVESDAAGSKFQLSDFHRLEVKGGRSVWEIKAKQATYFLSESVTHVNDAALILYRVDGSTVKIAADSANLSMAGDGISQAFLEGAVRVEFPNDLRIRSDNAIYDAQVGKVTAPGLVVIEGVGFAVQGKGLELDIESQELLLREQVASRFESSAQAPNPKKMYRVK